MEDLKERVIGLFKNIFERIQTSSFYVRIRDQFDNMSPSQQIASLIGLTLLFIFGLVYLPMTTYLASASALQEFDSARQTMRTLHKTYRESLNQPSFPVPPSTYEIKAMIEAKAKEMNLLPEQTKGIEPLGPTEVNSQVIPQPMRSGGLLARFSKLNLRQAVTLAGKIQQISPSVKLQDLLMVSNHEDPRYYDVNFMLVALNIPQENLPPPPPPPSRAKSQKAATAEETEE